MKNVKYKLQRGTLSYFQCFTWNKLNQRTVNGAYPQWHHRGCLGYLKRGIELRMSKDEFYAWCRSQECTILELYNSGNTPSIDRIDPEGHYSLDNIRILDFRENTLAGLRNYCKQASKPIRAIGPTGQVITFASITAVAERGFERSVVRQVLAGKRRTHGGFRWEHS